MNAANPLEWMEVTWPEPEDLMGPLAWALPLTLEMLEGRS